MGGNKENEEGQPGDLKYTGNQIGEIGRPEDNTNEDEYLLTKEETYERLAWLSANFLQGITPAHIWRTNVTDKLRDQEAWVSKQNLFNWATTSDLAYLIVLYEHNYDKWKKDYGIRGTTTRGMALTKEQKKTLDSLGKYKPDGVSSKDGLLRMQEVQTHIIRKILQVKDNRERMSEAFWKYYDENIRPAMVQSMEEMETNKADNPILLQKQKEAEAMNKLDEDLLYYNAGNSFDLYGQMPGHSGVPV